MCEIIRTNDEYYAITIKLIDNILENRKKCTIGRHERKKKINGKRRRLPSSGTTGATGSVRRFPRTVRIREKKT